MYFITVEGLVCLVISIILGFEQLTIPRKTVAWPITGRSCWYVTWSAIMKAVNSWAVIGRRSSLFELPAHPICWIVI